MKDFKLCWCVSFLFPFPFTRFCVVSIILAPKVLITSYVVSIFTCSCKKKIRMSNKQEIDRLVYILSEIVHIYMEIILRKL